MRTAQELFKVALKKSKQLTERNFKTPYSYRLLRTPWIFNDIYKHENPDVRAPALELGKSYTSLSRFLFVNLTKDAGIPNNQRRALFKVFEEFIKKTPPPVFSNEGSIMSNKQGLENFVKECGGVDEALRVTEKIRNKIIDLDRITGVVGGAPEAKAEEMLLNRTLGQKSMWIIALQLMLGELKTEHQVH